jgi:hypothetical protein
MSALLDRIAEENADILGSDDVQNDDGNDARMLMGSCVDMLGCVNAPYVKKASSGIPTISRIEQACDINMHQEDNTPTVWQVKKGKIIRITSQFIKASKQ